MKSKRLWLFGVCLTLVALFVCNVGFKEIYSLPDGFMASMEEIESANDNKTFGSFVSASMQRSVQSASTDKPSEGTVVFKLFGLIPIRKINKSLLPCFSNMFSISFIAFLFLIGSTVFIFRAPFIYKNKDFKIKVFVF